MSPWLISISNLTQPVILLPSGEGFVAPVDERYCKTCGEIKPITDFPKYRGESGKPLYKHRCKGCDNGLRKERYKAGGAVLLAEIAKQRKIAKLKRKLADLEAA